MRLPSLEAKDVIQILMANGFRKAGQKGSHVQFKNEKGTIITVPVHPGRKIGRGILRKILRDMEITREEFETLLIRA